MTKAKKPYRDLLKEELLEVARRLGLTNLSRLRKEEIVDLVEQAETRAERLEKPGVKKSQAAVSAKIPPNKIKAPPAKAVAARTPRTEPPPMVAKPGPQPSPLGPVSAQADAVATKYAMSGRYRPEELQRVDEELPALPESYGENRIVLLPRDLSWLFAYWDLSEEYKEAARAAGGSVLALRLYDVTGVAFDGTNARAMVEHECAEWARSWYLPTPNTDRDFIVEIGYRGADQWFPLARSNKVSVPSDQPSTWIKDDFVSIRFDESLRGVRDRLPTGGEPSRKPSTGAEAGQTLFDDGQLRIVVGGAFLPPSGVPTWPLFSGSEEVLRGGLPSSQMFVPGSAFQLPSSAIFSASFVPGSVVLFPSSGSAIPGSAFQLPSSSGFMQPPPGGGPGRGPLPPDTAEIGVAGGASTAAGAGSSSAPAPPILLANVEMVIYGKSMPGTDLRIAGRPIPMGPDGAFSLRVTVPEGERELPIEVRWANSSEIRRIKLKLGRETD
jgi:hypothetical protein